MSACFSTFVHRSLKWPLSIAKTDQDQKVSFLFEGGKQTRADIGHHVPESQVSQVDHAEDEGPHGKGAYVLQIES